MIETVLALALVFQDDVSMRGAARDGSPPQARLIRGELLEIRGESFDFYRVYDRRRQRQGYVHKWQVRVFDPKRADTPDILRVLVSLVKDAPGFETLGIGAATLFFDLAQVPQTGAADVYDAVGVMGGRLARRASKRHAGPEDGPIADHLELAEHYGLHFYDVERDNQSIVCEAGDAYRHVLALADAAPAAMARAALELTAGTCVDPLSRASTLVEWNRWRIDALSRVDLSQLPAHVATRIRLREAEAYAALVFELGRVKGTADPALPALALQAQKALMAADRTLLPDEERVRHDEVSMRVAASAGAAGAGNPTEIASGETKAVLSRPGDGTTCITIGKGKAHCTHGLPWLQSAQWVSQTLVVPLQTLAGWTELWVLSASKEDVLVAAATTPRSGYVELAGVSPDGKKLFVAREAMNAGQPFKRFAAVKIDTLDIERETRSLSQIPGFRRAASATWKERTLALRE